LVETSSADTGGILLSSIGVNVTVRAIYFDAIRICGGGLGILITLIFYKRALLNTTIPRIVVVGSTKTIFYLSRTIATYYRRMLRDATTGGTLP
jgi:hypothetical protein